MACQVGSPALGALALGWLAEFVGLQSAVGAGATLVIVVTTLSARILFVIAAPDGTADLDLGLNFRCQQAYGRAQSPRDD